MYNTTTKSFTVGDDSSEPYDWIIQDADKEACRDATDDDINRWIDEVIEYAIEYDDLAIEQQAENLNYPVYGYTTAQQFQNEDEYIAFKKQELRDDLAAERSAVFQFLKSWIADLEQ